MQSFEHNNKTKIRVKFQLALSSYYENADIDDDVVESSSPQPPQAPTSLFGLNNEAANKSDDKNKAKNKYNVGGARIMTLNNMSTDDDDDDDGSGQVSLQSLVLIFFCVCV